MILILTPNPAVDVTYRVREQRIGHTQRVLDVRRRPGGKGVNVARVLHAEGANTVNVLPLGGSAGQWLGRQLRADGLNVREIPLAAETRTTVTVVDDIAHPTMLGEPGPAITAGEWEQVTRAVAAALPEAEAFVIAGSLPAGTDPALVTSCVETARAAGVRTLTDVSGPALLAAAAAGVDVCKANRDELLEATGASDLAEGAAVLRARGAGRVLISQGADGFWSADADGAETVVPAVPGISGQPTGAGDAATAGLLLGISAAEDWPTSMRRAAAFGAASLLRPVAGEIDRKAAARFFADLAPLTSDPRSAL